jgi:hypothetical protein
MTRTTGEAGAEASERSDCPCGKANGVQRAVGSSPRAAGNSNRFVLKKNVP